MNQQPRERLNMPAVNEILNTTINRAFRKPETKQTNQNTPIVTLTCKVCSKEYNQNQKTIILEKLPTLPNFDHQSTCLSCIKQRANQIKASKYPDLIKLRKDLDEMNIAYQAVYNNWRALSNEYNTLAYQENMITHEQNQIALAKAKASAKKPSTKKPASTSLIMKILANLTPEQQASVIANMKAQHK